MRTDLVEEWINVLPREGKKDEVSGRILVSVLYDGPNNTKFFEAAMSDKQKLVFKYLSFEQEWTSRQVNKKVNGETPLIAGIFFLLAFFFPSFLILQKFQLSKRIHSKWSICS